MGIRFDLIDLQLFLHVIEAGSITGGAERAHLALASASVRIQGMEESLGVPLLTRGSRGVHPTPAGEAMVPHARAIVRQGVYLRAELNQFGLGLRGRVTLMCNTAALHEYLPVALGDFLATHPLVNVDIEERAGDDIVTAVSRDSVEIGIVSNEVSVDGVQTLPFFSDHLAIVTPPGHPLVLLAQQREIDIGEAASYDIIALSAGSALQEQWERDALRKGRRLNYRVRVPSFEAQCRLIERGAGICLMPEASARRLARTFEVEVVTVGGLDVPRNMLLCVRKLDALPAHTRMLVTHLAGAAQGRLAACSPSELKVP